jgi:hypothetical protein
VLGGRQGDFRAFLKQTGQTIGDIMFRVRVNLVYKRPIAKFGGHQGTLDRAAAAKWQPRTYCRAVYAIKSDCGHTF